MISSSSSRSRTTSEIADGQREGEGAPREARTTFGLGLIRWLGRLPRRRRPQPRRQPQHGAEIARLLDRLRHQEQRRYWRQSLRAGWKLADDRQQSVRVLAMAHLAEGGVAQLERGDTPVQAAVACGAGPGDRAGLHRSPPAPPRRRLRWPCTPPRTPSTRKVPGRWRWRRSRSRTKCCTIRLRTEVISSAIIGTLGPTHRDGPIPAPVLAWLR